MTGKRVFVVGGGNSAGQAAMHLAKYASEGWLAGAVLRDQWAFICTDDGIPPEHRPSTALPLQTSMLGVFAVGDVRRGSVKRVASAVGEGAVAAQSNHRYLAEAVGAADGDLRALT